MSRRFAILQNGASRALRKDLLAGPEAKPFALSLRSWRQAVAAWRREARASAWFDDGRPSGGIALVREPQTPRGRDAVRHPTQFAPIEDLAAYPRSE